MSQFDFLVSFLISQWVCRAHVPYCIWFLSKAFVLDERPDLWSDEDLIYLDINPWHGETKDLELLEVLEQLKIT